LPKEGIIEKAGSCGLRYIRKTIALFLVSGLAIASLASCSPPPEPSGFTVYCSVRPSAELSSSPSDFTAYCTPRASTSASSSPSDTAYCTPRVSNTVSSPTPAESYGIIPIDTAGKLIQGYIDDKHSRDPENCASFSIYSIAELDIGDAFSKMSFQGYAVSGDDGSSHKYIICSGSVIEASLEHYVTADIDKDEEYEFLDAGTGPTSGVRSYMITACKYGIPAGSSSKVKELYAAYSVLYTPDPNFDKIDFVRISDTEVHISGTGYKGQVKDLGVLRVTGKELSVS
jgi:hypothetical protein